MILIVGRVCLPNGLHDSASRQNRLDAYAGNSEFLFAYF
jgi:hypothetical protein